MLPLTDTVRPRRLPLVTLAIVAANVAVWLAYELPAGIEEAVETIGSWPCAVEGTCPESTDLPWPVAIATSMFGHGSWGHILGNMLFLAVFGPRVEDGLGRLRYAALYLVAGVGAVALQAGTTLAFAPAADAAIPMIGASGAISGVLGAYVVAHPFQRVLIWVIPVLFLRVPALGLLGVWFVLQALEGAYALSHPGLLVGIAFMAHAGGFLAGALFQLVHDGRLRPHLPARPAGSSRA